MKYVENYQNQIWKRETQRKTMETRMLLEIDVRMDTSIYIHGQYWKNGWKSTEIKQKRRQNI